MSLPVPELDDRTFADLVLAARERIQQTCPTWTDLSVHDPGMALVESFAYLTEIMLYRLNRLPEKAYIAFLNLLGATRRPPAAAWVDLTFVRAGGRGAITIPAGTKVASARGADPAPVVFVTTASAVLPAEVDEVVVRAHHCELVAGELLGRGTGGPGQRFQTAKVPIATTTEPLDLLLGVETASVTEGAAAREHGGRTFEIWQQVPTFAAADPGAKAYLLDRATGSVTFAPALDTDAGPPQPVAAVPPSGNEVRLWYPVGGGPAGNVAVDTLTVLRAPIAGVKVTNREPARGGRAIEPIEATIARGPYEFFSQRRAVTARDFELLAIAGSPAVARARAFTRASAWAYAPAGEVEVALVPHVGEEARPAWRLPEATLVDYQVDNARLQVQQDLAGRCTIGTECLTTWARCKTVSIEATVVVRAEEDVDAVQRRIHDRLYQTISPLPTPLSPGGWGFGEPLRASNVYRMLEQSEPGVKYVDEVRFRVDEAPDGVVRAVAADAYQPNTWYAGCGEVLFRSTNDGWGWEPAGRFPGEEVRRVVPAPAAIRSGMVARPGMVAVATRRNDGQGAGIYVSSDLGETWRKVGELGAGVSDLAWIDRGEAAALLLASDVGLYELALVEGGTPLQVVVDPDDQDRGFYAVSSFVSERGVQGVALAAQAQYGVYLSTEAGRRDTFTNIGLSGTETRTMTVQLDGAATVLWVGASEPDPNRPGQGCIRARLFEADIRWEPLPTGWGGGTCWDIALRGTTVFASTQSGGVLSLDSAASAPSWQPASVNSGLPLRDRPRFEAVESVAAAGPDKPVLAGGTKGVFRSADGAQWTATANRVASEVVTIPDTWLLCSGEHRIEVIR